MAFSALQALQSFGLGSQMAERNAESKRRAEARSALSEYVLAGRQPRASSHSLAPTSIGNNPTDLRSPVVGQPPAMMSYAPGEDPTAVNMLAAGEQVPVQAPQQSMAVQLARAGQRAVDPAFERLARADGELALKARSAQAEYDDDELKKWSSINAAGLQILGGVHDQSSYEAALRRARALYNRFGEDDSAFADLPQQYSPEIVQQARLEALQAKDYFGALRADRHLDWNIEDDLLDNERADRNTDSLIGTREEQLSNTRRGQDLTNSRGIRGQDVASGDRRRGQDITSRDRVRGQDVTSRDRVRGQDVSSTDRRRGQDIRARIKGRPVAGKPVATDEPVALVNGKPHVVRNGQWVPAT